MTVISPAHLEQEQETIRQAQVTVSKIIARQSRVINREYVKRWALDYARDKRSHQFTRVSEEFLNAVEHATKAFIRDRIDRAPSKGCTLK